MSKIGFLPLHIQFFWTGQDLNKILLKFNLIQSYKKFFFVLKITEVTRKDR